MNYYIKLYQGAKVVLSIWAQSFEAAKLMAATHGGRATITDVRTGSMTTI